jgi:hypothetical protein
LNRINLLFTPGASLFPSAFLRNRQTSSLLSKALPSAHPQFDGKAGSGTVISIERGFSRHFGILIH